MTSDPFETLGFPRRFRIDAANLAQRHRDLSRALHPDRFVQAAPAERRVAIEKAAAVNDAFRRLRDPQMRAAALLAFAGRPVREDARAAPELLTEVLDLRERLEEAKSQKDDTRRITLRDSVATRIAQSERVIADAFETDVAPTGDTLDRAYEALVTLKYLYRFLEEADAVDD